MSDGASHYRHLARGFNWLGGATVISRVVDLATILVVLLYLSKAEVGVAALVISIGMVVEAFDGLGTSEAMIQARAVSRAQLDTLFWFILGIAAMAAGAVLLAAPLIERIYGVPGMGAYFLVIAAKQPLVGAAVIPIALLNRQLKYERIAVVNVLATMAAAATRLGLAVGGAGAWALVWGFASSGFYILVGAMVFRPFRPRLRFDWPGALPLVRFGLRATASNIFEQIFKNIDYLLIGAFYGAAELAVYRVAFDVAMEPAVAVGALVNRTAMPVFARVSAARDRLAQSVTWSLRRLVILVAPLMVGLILAAQPLMTVLHDGQGRSYAAAALPLQLLAAAALLRVLSQLLMPLLLGAGRPGTVAWLSGATLALLGCRHPRRLPRVSGGKRHHRRVRRLAWGLPVAADLGRLLPAAAVGYPRGRPRAGVPRSPRWRGRHDGGGGGRAPPGFWRRSQDPDRHRSGGDGRSPTPAFSSMPGSGRTCP